MTPHDDDSSGLPHSPASDEEAASDSTGLPWPRTWLGLYIFVMCCFVMWVALLVVLERSFS